MNDPNDDASNQMIRAALASISRNEIIRYYDSIDELDLLTLEMRSRVTYEAIKRPDARRVLIAIGLMKVSTRKTVELEIELDETFTNYMADPRPEHRELGRKFERLRQMLIDHSGWKFDIAAADTGLILGSSPVGKLFHACDVLVSGIHGNPYWPAWREIAHHYIGMPSKTESAFKSICYILEANLRPNRDFLRKFIQSNGL